MTDSSGTSPEDKKPAKRKLEERVPRKQKPEDPFLRAANEDDDGYDPYSDRPARDDMWEEDPWR